MIMVAWERIELYHQAYEARLVPTPEALATILLATRVFKSIGDRTEEIPLGDHIGHVVTGLRRSWSRSLRGAGSIRGVTRLASRCVVGWVTPICASGRLGLATGCGSARDCIRSGHRGYLLSELARLPGFEPGLLDSESSLLPVRGLAYRSLNRYVAEHGWGRTSKGFRLVAFLERCRRQLSA